jgi:EAL domain-containing protein (putative c-di-GMP-specific phosphodiesterase class I)
VAVAASIRLALQEPVALQGLQLFVEASTGVALSPGHGTDASTLLRHADVAMYDAKRHHLAHVVFSEVTHGGARSRLETVAQLRTGIAAGELVLHYQPQLDLASGRVVGLEALVRWQHPDRGLLAPDAFLDLAEHAGLMPVVVDQVLGMALGDLARWRRTSPDLSVSVNVSASNLSDLGLPALVRSHLARAGVPASALTLEITENVLMEDARTAQAVLLELRDLGVGLSVDDYGTGYSSLGYLRELPVDEVKLDRSFVGPCVGDARSAVIVRNTIALSRELGLRMVAEGVEDAGALALLQEWGCDVAQGFYIARPMPARAVAEWLSALCRVEAVPA